MSLQVRFKSADALADEHKRSNGKSAMLPTDLAKPIGVVNGTSVSGTRRPRTTGPASECISHKLNADGSYTSTIFAPSTKSTKTRTGRKSASRAELEAFRAEMLERASEHRVTAADLAPVNAD